MTNANENDEGREMLSQAEQGVLKSLDAQMTAHPKLTEPLSDELMTEVRRLTQGVAP